MASLYKLPCIFVVENNMWAIGMSHARATGLSDASDNQPFIYKKGPAFGMPGILVDGMDVRKVNVGAWRLSKYVKPPIKRKEMKTNTGWSDASDTEPFIYKKGAGFGMPSVLAAAAAGQTRRRHLAEAQNNIFD